MRNRTSKALRAGGVWFDSLAPPQRSFVRQSPVHIVSNFGIWDYHFGTTTTLGRPFPDRLCPPFLSAFVGSNSLRRRASASAVMAAQFCSTSCEDSFFSRGQTVFSFKSSAI